MRRSDSSWAATTTTRPAGTATRVRAASAGPSTGGSRRAGTVHATPATATRTRLRPTVVQVTGRRSKAPRQPHDTTRPERTTSTSTTVKQPSRATAAAAPQAGSTTSIATTPSSTAGTTRASIRGQGRRSAASSRAIARGRRALLTAATPNTTTSTTIIDLPVLSATGPSTRELGLVEGLEGFVGRHQAGMEVAFVGGPDEGHGPGLVPG